MSGEPWSPVTAWFRSSRSMLAAELKQGGWLNFGAFRWSDIDIPRALRAGAGMITPLALGLATGHLEYGVFATLGALNGNGADAVVAGVDRFAGGVEDAGRVIAGSLRSLRPPGDMPPLREWQTAIYEQLTAPGPPAVLAGPAEVLTSATDEFADALDTAADVLRRRLSG